MKGCVPQELYLTHRCLPGVNAVIPQYSDPDPASLMEQLGMDEYGHDND
jgi:hypothetical protein